MIILTLYKIIGFTDRQIIIFNVNANFSDYDFSYE